MRPKFNIRRKWAGIPIAAKITPTVRPAVVRGTGAPKPVKLKKYLRENKTQYNFKNEKIYI